MKKGSHFFVPSCPRRAVSIFPCSSLLASLVPLWLVDTMSNVAPHVLSLADGAAWLGHTKHKPVFPMKIKKKYTNRANVLSKKISMATGHS